jgi:hypothetical protein
MFGAGQTLHVLGVSYSMIDTQPNSSGSSPHWMARSL